MSESVTFQQVSQDISRNKILIHNMKLYCWELIPSREENDAYNMAYYLHEYLEYSYSQTADKPRIICQKCALNSIR